MEIQYSLLSTTTGIIFLIISTLIFLLASLRNIKRHSPPKLPPGPWKLPIIGNLHNLLAGPLPHHTLRNLSRKHGPLMHLQLGEISAIVVSSPSMAREVLKTHDLCFAQRPLLLSAKIATYGEMGIAFSPYGDYWRQMRKVCTVELLSAKKVRSFAFIREEEVFSLIESIRSSCASNSPIINLSEKAFASMSSITFRSAFGNKCKDEAALLYLINEGKVLGAGFSLSDLFPSKKFLQVMTGMPRKLERIFQKMDNFLQTIIDDDEHVVQSETTQEQVSGSEAVERDDHKADFVHVLLKLQRSGSLEIPITTDHIKAVIFDMIAAGIETAATTVEWAMAEMMKNPRVMEKAQAEVRRVLKGNKAIHERDINELTYLKLVIKETLRLHPPAPFLVPRECRETCSIGGYEIPAKTKVLINVWALGRDPEYWEDAESFIPERFIDSNDKYDFLGTKFEFIPFGAGRRICPGISYGLAKVEFALSQLLYHFNWEFPVRGMRPQSLDMTEAFGLSVGKKQNLCLRAVPFMSIQD